MPSQKELGLDTPREKERARERKAALWILIVTMAVSAILALALTAYFQKP
jgi:flagellar basal body-associated protein FliL